MDGRADLKGGVTESLLVVGGINEDWTFHVRLLARLLADPSILMAVVHRTRTSSAFNSLTFPQPTNERNYICLFYLINKCQLFVISTSVYRLSLFDCWIKTFYFNR
jgi:hypothetical protein